MSRFFFDLRVESVRLPDYEGHELSREEDVRRYAEELALKLRKSDVFSLAGAAVEVRSQDGKRLFSIPVEEWLRNAA